MPATDETPAAVTASALTVAKVVGASEAHVLRVRGLAGSRLRTRSKGCADCQTATKGVSASSVASTLGAEQVREIISGHTSEAALVAGAGAELADVLRRFGLSDEWAQQLGTLVEQHGLRTLYEGSPPPLPAGYSAVVARAVAA